MTRLYLGLDSSTQSLTAIVIEARGERRRVVFESAFAFDEELPQYGTRHGVLPREDPTVAVSSPVMWAEALDRMLARVAASGLDMAQLAAVSGSAQQHGSVYLNVAAGPGLARFDPAHPPGAQVAPLLARAVAPVWLDSSTTAECAEITAAVGGAEVLARHTGSRAFERFTGPQIRRFSKTEPAAYAATERIHLVSSFLASLLTGAHAPLDPGDASGTNLMDLTTRRWWAPALRATAPDLAAKLPPIVPSSTVIGTLSRYWQTRHGLPPAHVVAWSGDNPCSLVGVGLVREGRVAVSLGTSDTIFGLMTAPRVDAGGTGHVFGAPTGDYMGLTCFSNGSLAREHVREMCGLSWSGFSEVLERTPAGNGGRVLLPWFAPEITPPVPTPGARRYGFDAGDRLAHVRAVVEGQLTAMALHARWMAVTIDTIHATGGAAANRQILQIMADVFGAEVYRTEVANSAALGAALRAIHADDIDRGDPSSWPAVVATLAEPIASSRIASDARRRSVYRELMPVYEACEAHALGHGPDPTARLEPFRGAP